MRITFIHSEDESLGIEYLSSLLKKCGHETSLIFDPWIGNWASGKDSIWRRLSNIKDELIREVFLSEPDLVGFSLHTGSYQWALGMARALKSRSEVPIIFGGIHPTSVPEEVLKNDCVDMVCLGEGEGAILDLANGLDEGGNTSIENIWFKEDNQVIKNEIRPPVEDLDSLPFPDKELFARKLPGSLRHTTYLIMTSRGCPFACTFCSNNILRKLYHGYKYARKRSIENVVEELSWAKKKYTFRRVSLMDDVFVTESAWLSNFVDRYAREINAPFSCFLHPQFVSKDTIKLLKEGGCFWLKIGIQSASERTRKELLKRPETNEQIIKVAHWCHKARLNFSVDHIFNIPFEGAKEQESALSLYNQLRPVGINSFGLIYFPGTEIIKSAQEAQLLSEKDIEAINQGRLFVSSNISGFLGKDSLHSDRRNYNFTFLFSLLPLLPQRLMNYIIRRKWYKIPFRVPALIQVGVKFLAKLKAGQAYVYFSALKFKLFSLLKLLEIKLSSFRRASTNDC
ncbi:B12-binding domain-containing radical SAM protein [bacterium]|nr:B12-binding domain-containing radical SAM protein [bacterium]